MKIRVSVKDQIVLIAVFVLAIGFTYEANAAGSSGIEIGLDSARALGKGNAVVADPKDASTLVYNPAGLTKVEGTQMTMNSTTLVPLTEYNSTTGTSEDGSTLPAYIPSFFIAFDTPIDHLKLGGGTNSPFGLANQWSSTGNFKYTGISSEIKSIYYTAAGAYELNPWLSFGGGVSYVDSDLRQISKLNATALVGSGGDFDTEIDTEGHGIGWNMGVLVTPSDKWSIGFFYRSAVRTPVDGEYNADDIPAGAAQAVFGGSTFRTSVNTDMTFPDSAVLGVNYKVADNLDFEVDFGWTGWGKWDHFDFTFGTTNSILDGSEPAQHKFKDTISINTGINYKVNSNWDLSAGYAFYEQAALENDYHNVFLDGDRHSITFGVQYNVNQWTIGVAYSGQFVSEVDIDNNVGSANGASVDGNYKGFYHVVLTSVTYKFS